MAVVVGDRPSLTYTLRDPVTGALVNGTVVCTVTKPDGSAPSPPAVVNDGVGLYHAQITVDQAGLWRWTFTASGAVIDTTDGALYVWPVGQALPWVPSLAQVAGYVPSRTVPIDTAMDNPLDTFTDATVPDASQAYDKITAAVGWVTTKVGAVHASLYQQASDVAAMRAAGLIELSYPIRDADVAVGQNWLDEAEKAVAALLTANSNVTGTDPEEVLPVWSFPVPVAYGDLNL